MKRTMAFLAAVTAIALTAGCNIPDPCASAPAPSPELIKIAQDPRIEVDYVVSDTVECDMVVTGNTARWERESE